MGGFLRLAADGDLDAVRLADKGGAYRAVDDDVLERALVGFHAAVLQYLEIAVGGHQALQLYLVGADGHAGYYLAYLVPGHERLDVRGLYQSVAGHALGEQLGEVARRHQPGLVDQLAVLVEVLRHELVVFRRGDDARRLDDVAVLVEVRRRYLHQLLGLFEQGLVLVGQGLGAVGAQHQHVQVYLARERQLEVARAVPQPGVVEHLVAVRHAQLAVVAELVEVLESGLVQAIELDGQPSGLGHAVEEAQVHGLRLLLPLVVHVGVVRDEAEVCVLLQYVFIPYVHRGTPVVGLYAGIVGLVGQGRAVRPYPLAAEQEEGGLVLGVPLVHAVAERGVV